MVRTATANAPQSASYSETPPSIGKQSLRDSYLTEQELADQLPRGNVRKLRAWRNLRTGPKWLKIGREVVYLRSDVDAWMRREAELTLDREQRPFRRQRRAGARP